MLINEDYKFAFIHIPKNAGRSVRFILGCLKQNEEVSGTHMPLHKALEEYEGDVTDFYSFAFVRNPWDRALSLFHFYKANKHSYIRLPPKQDFNEWAIDTFDTTNPDRGSILRNSMVKRKSTKAFGQKFTEEQFDQCRWISDDINYIGRVETFNEDLINICSEIGILGRRDKGKIDVRTISEGKYQNKTVHDPYHSVYNKEARDVVADFFQRDIERFKYEFIKL